MTAFIYSDEYLKYQFGPSHPFQPIREKLTLDALASLGVFEGCQAKVVTPDPVDLDTLELVHAPHYIHYVKEMCEEGSGLLDEGDTPATKGLYEGALSAVGGSVRGARGIMEGEFDHAFNPAGGLHHAHAGRASGFCVFNDIAVAVRVLQKEYGLERVAVVDIDGHHGDGTQETFYAENVLTISLHRYGQRFFPGTGNVDEIGEGEGKGYNINIPLPPGTDDNLYLKAYRSIVVPALHTYQPQFIVHQFGVDGHYLDPLVRLGLTTGGYETIARLTHGLAEELSDGQYLVLGGGGYDIDAVRRTWSIMFSAVSQSYPENSPRIAAMHDREALFSNTDISDHINNTIERLEAQSLPLLEKLIKFA